MSFSVAPCSCMDQPGFSSLQGMFLAPRDRDFGEIKQAVLYYTSKLLVLNTHLLKIANKGHITAKTSTGFGYFWLSDPSALGRSKITPPS